MPLVKVLKCFKSFNNYEEDNALSEILVETGFKEVGEAPCVHIFDENPKPVLKEVPVVVPHNVRMIAYRHERDFIPYRFLLRRNI